LRAGEEAGIVTAAGVNPCGTSAIAESEVNPFFVPEVGILNDGDKLYPTSAGIAYQWYLDGTPIDGATSDTLVPVVSGTYTVLVVFSNSCTALSLPVEVIISGLFNPPSTATLDIYPMPVRETLNIKGITGEYVYTIFDITGTLLTQQKSFDSSIDVSALSEGAYMLRVQQSSTIHVARFVVVRK
jgi:Secretion system C-terminal sorting domain